jgi:hypothetical protein
MADGILVGPGDIAALGDDVLDHLEHFTPGEKSAIALYLLSQTSVDVPPADRPAAIALAAEAMKIGAAERSGRLVGTSAKAAPRG